MGVIFLSFIKNYDLMIFFLLNDEPDVSKYINFVLFICNTLGVSKKLEFDPYSSNTPLFIKINTPIFRVNKTENVRVILLGFKMSINKEYDKTSGGVP